MLVTICGKACSGKDYLLNEFVELGFKKIVSNTSRPPRPGEIDGVAYNFKTAEDYFAVKDDCFHPREYHVANGETWYYWFTNEEIDNAINDDKLHVNIADAECAIELRDKGAELLYIQTSTKERLRRYLKREEKSENPDYKEIIRRVLADEEDFDEAGLFDVYNIFDSLYYWDGSNGINVFNNENFHSLRDAEVVANAFKNMIGEKFTKM